MAFIDEAGNRYGRWLVLSRGQASNPVRRDAHWLCRCDCGIERVVDGKSLRGGRSRSCGCWNNELLATSKPSLTHGMSKSPEFYLWNAMIQRCHNQRNQSYSDYGGRGIGVHPDWRADFSRFFSHVGPRPSDKHTIERIDNSRGYEPGNVRWSTRAEQSRNKRNNHWITHSGRTMCITDWIKELGLNKGTVYSDIKEGRTIPSALGLA